MLSVHSPILTRKRKVHGSLISLFLGSIAYLWHSGYLHQGIFEEFRNRFSINKSETVAESEVKPGTETSIVPQSDAAPSDHKPATKDESQSNAKSSKALPNTQPASAPALTVTVPASKPVNR